MTLVVVALRLRCYQTSTVTKFYSHLKPCRHWFDKVSWRRCLTCPRSNWVIQISTKENTTKERIPKLKNFYQNLHSSGAVFPNFSEVIDSLHEFSFFFLSDSLGYHFVNFAWHCVFFGKAQSSPWNFLPFFQVQYLFYSLFIFDWQYKSYITLTNIEDAFKILSNCFDTSVIFMTLQFIWSNSTDFQRITEP